MLLSRAAESNSRPTKSRSRKASSVVANRLKLIDFGEANETIKADRIEVGTAGYMAPEVRTDGDCTSSSDVYSAGVSLIEIWHGGLWAGAETRGEGAEGMRREIMDVSFFQRSSAVDLQLDCVPVATRAIILFERIVLTLHVSRHFCKPGTAGG